MSSGASLNEVKEVIKTKKTRTKKNINEKKNTEKTLSDDDVKRLSEKFLMHMQQTQLYMSSFDEDNWKNRRKMNAMANDLRVKTDLGLTSYDINSIITSIVHKMEESEMKKRRDNFITDVQEGFSEDFVYKFLSKYDEYDIPEIFSSENENEKQINQKCLDFINSIREFVVFKLEILNNDIKNIISESGKECQKTTLSMETK